MTQTPNSLSPRQRVVAFHNVLLAHSFYPLFLCTLLGLAFHATRTVLMHRFEYRCLIWNLFLAWIPYWLSVVALRLHQARPIERDRTLIALVWLAWLFMFPNAPYILTDFVHIWDTPLLTWWFDLGMITTFALAGCFCGIVSLRIMHDLVRSRIGIAGGWVFVTTIATLAGLGIYIGRFLRWNSWDLLTHPHRILAQLADRAINPFAHPRTIGVTLMFGAMLLVMYVMFVSMSARTQRD